MSEITDEEKSAEILKTIKRIRESKGISQRQLAGMIGFNISNWNKTENGLIGLKVSTIFRVADALELEPAMLLGRYSDTFNEAWDLFQQISPERQARILAQLADLAQLESE